MVILMAIVGCYCVDPVLMGIIGCLCFGCDCVDPVLMAVSQACDIRLTSSSMASSTLAHPNTTHQDVL